MQASEPERVERTRLEGLCSALVRALTGDARLQWSGQRLHRGTDCVPLNAAHQRDASWSLADQRAQMDGAALRLRTSDARLHAHRLPDDAVERLVHELLEQLRCESLVRDDWPGVKENLAQRFLRWCEAFVASGLTETSLGILLFTLAATVWTRLTGHPLPDDMADRMETTRASMAPQIGQHLEALRRHRTDQARYQSHALAVARWLAQAVHAAQAEVPTGAQAIRLRNGFALPLHFESQNLDAPPEALSGSSRSWDAMSGQYRVFTRAYDREVLASSLVRAAQLTEFRTQMDREVQALGVNIPWLARQLRERLAVPQRDGWLFAQEEGQLDGARLAQLVADPQHRAVFKAEWQRPATACAVTLLLDCSGSMKAHATTLSLLVDVVGRALDMAGVTVEILGFSTGAWHGGRARRDWQRAGQPEFPGRLNEVLHLVYKDAHVSWQQGRTGIAALRRSDLFREGVDGEAVAWACKRLLGLPVSRRVLMVVSDGCPMDTATHQCHDDHYLDQHLRQVVATQESHENVGICALGVGLDLGVFYKRRLAVEPTDGVTQHLLQSIAALIVRSAAAVADRPFHPFQ